MKKILLLGATGRTGKYLLNRALELGYLVNILVRDKSKIEVSNKNLQIFEGLASNKNDLEKAILGCNNVISALNISRNSDFPWAGLRTPKDFLKETVKNLIEIYPKQKFEKLIITSAWGVLETKKDIPFWFRWMIDFSNIKYGYLAHEKCELLLQKSSLNWTSVRPVGLTNFEKIKPVITTINNSPKPSLTISRMNTANFILGILEKDIFEKQAVTISE